MDVFYKGSSNDTCDSWSTLTSSQRSTIPAMILSSIKSQPVMTERKIITCEKFGSSVAVK
jgi:hypothetical protein